MGTDQFAGGDRFEAVIVGGGVAALEAALCLRAHASDLIHVSLLAPEAEFVYRPMRVGEPFGHERARRYRLAQIAADLDVERHADRLSWVDPAAREVHTRDGLALGYDALLLCLGARQAATLPHAITIDPPRLDEQLHGFVQDLEGGWLRNIAFVIPPGSAWPLPMYEIALMSAQHAYEMSVDANFTLVTPEAAPLAVLGKAASDALADLLAQRGITTITSAHCSMPEVGYLTVHPSGRELEVDRVVALPQLRGAAVPGVPHSAEGGFLSVDAHAAVAGLEGVYAAGDITDFPVKHGGLAALQADAAAESIAALAGAPIVPRPMQPVVTGVIWTGREPLYVRGRVTGSHGIESEARLTPPSTSTAKIHARYLAPYLDALDHAPLATAA